MAAGWTLFRSSRVSRGVANRARWFAKYSLKCHPLPGNGGSHGSLTTVGGVGQSWNWRHASVTAPCAAATLFMISLL
jgi:hypothetical protein